MYPKTGMNLMSTKTFLTNTCLTLVTCWVFDGSLAIGQTKGGPVYESPEAAVVDPDFSVQGEYVGDAKALQVVALGSGQFQVKVFDGGLPGSTDKVAITQTMELPSKGVTELFASGSFNRIYRTSPTLNSKPPAGAVVLFDGSDESLEAHWKPGAKKTKEG
ncbi:MAG TPA: hypothetical protein DDW52_06215, partial [Planctomycetaceae bacterium]|nr:hypothetical protein [Planctomycetaceae bacterium]